MFLLDIQIDCTVHFIFFNKLVQVSMKNCSEIISVRFFAYGVVILLYI